MNCCAPDDVLPALEVARTVTGRPGVAYPNSGQGWDAVRRTWTGDSAFDAGAVADWLAAGARLVGGCCRVGPSGTAAVARQLTAHA